MYWRVFDPGQPEYVIINNCNKTNETCPPEDVDVGMKSVEFSHFMGIVMWLSYQAITVILLLNILIAMMNTTYSDVWQNRDVEWNYSKTFYQVEFISNEAILPPPFRLGIKKFSIECICIFYDLGFSTTLQKYTRNFATVPQVPRKKTRK